MKVFVSEELDGTRADRAVAALCEVSRSVVKRSMDAGGVTRGGEALRPADAVATGDELTVDLDLPVSAAEPEPSVVFDVAYEDDAVLVVDKPAGLVVHPGAGVRSGTLVGGLLARDRRAADLGPDRRWGIVHRLDRETSGLLMVARTPDALHTLQDALRKRAVRRRYLTLVSGHLPSTTGTIEAPIGRDPSNPTRMAVTAGGRPARTHYRVLARWDDPAVSLLSVELETGRTHQIRAHFLAIDRPIVGDPVYGPSLRIDADPGRTWLHAVELAFPHPSDRGVVTVESALPADLAGSLERLGPPVDGSVPK